MAIPLSISSQFGPVDGDYLLSMMDQNDIHELFMLCDTNNSGFIEKEELHSIAPHLDGQGVDELLSDLDTDGDGRISLAEMKAGLEKIVRVGSLMEMTNNKINIKQKAKQKLLRR